MEFKTKIERLLLDQLVNTGKIDLSALERKKKVDFFDFFENYVMKVSNVELSTGTVKIYKRTLKYLKEFSSEISIDKVNVEFLERFNKFLIEQKNLKINTRASLFNKVKKVILVAVQNDHINFSANPFYQGFSIREVEPEKKSLTLSELKKIASLDMSQRPELEKAKDMFLLASYTGLRFGDLSLLSFENFEVLENGKIRLIYQPAKTSRLNGKWIKWIVSDFWNGKIDEIIHKYFRIYEPYKKHPIEKRLFFNISNQKYNEKLKEIQRFANIKTNLTSHLARHTYITLLINEYSLDITKAQLIAGHSKIEMTQKYLRITERDLSDAGKKIVW